MAGQTIDDGVAGRGDIDKRARAIAEEFEATDAQASEAIRHLVEGLPSLQLGRQDLASSSSINYADQFLRAACRELEWRQAFELVTSTPLDLLETRVWATHYLSGAEDEIPLFSRKYLADQLGAFHEFLIGDRQHLLDTGLPSRTFPSCPWLWLKAGKLYPIRRTENRLPFSDAIEYAGVPSHYKWVHVSRRVGGPSVVLRTICEQKEADLIPGITVADADRLLQFRLGLLELKIAVLAKAGRFLQSSENDLWAQCLPHFRTTLMAPDVELCLRMDRIYSEMPDEVKNLDSVFASLTGYDGPLQPGGFTSLVELIGHVEKERTIGTMHQTRKALRNVSIKEQGRPAGLPNDPWSYFSFVGDEVQSQLDQAIEIFLECDRCEPAFWQRFSDRVASDMVTDRTRDSAPGSFAHELQLKVQTFTDSKKDYCEIIARVDALELRFPDVRKTPTNEPRNIFRRNGTDWEIQFKDGPLNTYRGLDGLFYIATLIQSPPKGLFPSELRSAKTQFVGGVDSRSVVAAGNISADSWDSSSDAGEMIDSQARNEYEKRLKVIDEQLADARDLNEESKIIKLEVEKKQICAALREATGLGGRSVRISPVGKNVRDAVKKAIDRAVGQIGRKDKALETHFSKSLEFKDSFSYCPENTTVWIDH